MSDEKYETASRPRISVVVPAMNEEATLPRTLSLIRQAAECYTQSVGEPAEVIVVSNGSTDRTVAVAEAEGARVVELMRPNIAAARNAGAQTAQGRWLIFCDADTAVPANLLIAVNDALSDPRCLGGAPGAVYHYRKRSLWLHMSIWRVVASLRHMTQGVCQFCTADAFHAVSGYPEDHQMAEDTEFYWRLRRYAGWHGAYVKHLDTITVIASSRRLDEWPVWKTYLMMSPITTSLCRRSSRLWGSWTDGSVR